jgi:ribosomal protein S18 acetylase RimI-like enzyme
MSHEPPSSPALALTVTASPDAADLQKLGSALSAFNDADVGPSSRQPLAILIKDASGQLVAGLSGYTAWGWLYIQWLWVSETARGQKLAGKMLAAAEAEAHNRNCHSAHIDTFSPTALRVYKKAGYTIFGELPDFPVGRTRSFLSKRLASA